MIELKPGLYRAIDPAAIRGLHIDDAPILLSGPPGSGEPRRVWFLHAEVEVGSANVVMSADFDSLEAARARFTEIMAATQRAQLRLEIPQNSMSPEIPEAMYQAAEANGCLSWPSSEIATLIRAIAKASDTADPRYGIRDRDGDPL